MAALSLDVREKCFPAVGEAPAKLVLAGIRLTVAAGERLAMIGPSGCGKTTLLNIVAGLDRDFAGRSSSAPGPARLRVPGAAPPALAHGGPEPAPGPARGAGPDGAIAARPWPRSGSRRPPTSTPRACRWAWPGGRPSPAPSSSSPTCSCSTSRSSRSTSPPPSGCASCCSTCSTATAPRPCSSPTRCTRRSWWPTGSCSCRPRRPGSGPARGAAGPRRAPPAAAGRGLPRPSPGRGRQLAELLLPPARPTCRSPRELVSMTSANPWLLCFQGILWREFLRFLHQRGRFFAALVRPLVWLFIFAAGFRSVLGVSYQPPYETYILYEVYITPGLCGMILLFSGMQSSLSMVYDREMGSMRVLLVSPMPRWWLLSCKLVAGRPGRLLPGLRLPRHRLVLGGAAAADRLSHRLPGADDRRPDAGLPGPPAVLGDPPARELRRGDELRHLPDVLRELGPLPLWRMRESSLLLYQISAANPFSHAVELIRFALYGQLEPTSLLLTLMWTALFLAAALYGYNPARGFVALTGKGEMPAAPNITTCRIPRRSRSNPPLISASAAGRSSADRSAAGRGGRARCNAGVARRHRSADVAPFSVAPRRRGMPPGRAGGVGQAGRRSCGPPRRVIRQASSSACDRARQLERVLHPAAVALLILATSRSRASNVAWPRAPARAASPRQGRPRSRPGTRQRAGPAARRPTPPRPHRGRGPPARAVLTTAPTPVSTARRTAPPRRGAAPGRS